ncbi:hypothetical protein CAOG_02194 [Capsaspora owczarzaki ATCC 30864]|uniref:Phytocyanin domain-containing protein n=1 Tax=Capsaspora owczarzaki (strain ATCC 30864) TaxID=595528 RepID=A0A0D2WLU3_CAPO3|nr:hypothetical protein CAOG_02194 [Capsaspora owczarzaki ATCC 30864]KJE90978.1 hypothetical protein CAOG_002194 [Capsaspora owczarzaki ATCC 30864]|eukprot:XP_004348944.1 hypothetical protein CAOG_02194 [Capsaspora owczarzaki ATCC 30864]
MHRLISVIALVCALFAGVSFGASTTPVTWGPSPINTVALSTGDSLQFTVGAGHTLVRQQSCSSAPCCTFGAGDTMIAGSGGAATQTFSAAGTYYYACNIGAHCSSLSMHLQVVVTDAVSTTPAVSTTAATTGGSVSVEVSTTSAVSVDVSTTPVSLSTTATSTAVSPTHSRTNNGNRICISPLLLGVGILAGVARCG